MEILVCIVCQGPKNGTLGTYGFKLEYASSSLHILKQVAQRGTIAHLSPMCQHPLISYKPASKVIKKFE